MRLVFLVLGIAILVQADEADRIVADEMARQHIPGVSIAILRDGRVVKAQGYGLANIELNVPATAESVFRIGSVSKQFIAAGILMLQQEGRLDVDDPVAKHPPDAPPSWRGITLRHLLSHTSGIVREGPIFSPLRVRPDIEIVRSAYPVPLDFTTGEKYQYCNVCYFALAEVIARTAGRPWPDYLRDRIFIPLGMTATRPTTHDELVSHRASGYVWENGQYRNSGALLTVRPSGALLSTVIDLAKWDAALSTDQPLTAATRREAWTPIRLNSGRTYGYGLGWNVGERDGRAYVAHGGALSGFKSHFTRYLNEKLSLIVLANADQAKPNEIVDRLADAYLAPRQSN